MSINEFLPDSRKVAQNDIDTLFDLRVISLRYQMGKITANEAMVQVDERLNKNEEVYNEMHRLWYVELGKENQRIKERTEHDS